MGQQGFQKEIKVQGVSRDSANELDRRNHGLSGTVLLLSSSNYTGVAGVAPTGNYIGFVVGSGGVTISSITYNFPEEHTVYTGESLNSLGFVPGAYYPLDGIKTITISAGAILLYK